MTAPDPAPRRIHATSAASRPVDEERLWPFEHEVTVPWRDLDAAGHLNNAKYFSYMEDARSIAYLRARGIDTASAMRPEDLDIILAHASCDFRSAALMGETLVVRLWPTRVGNTSFSLRYEITEKVSGRTVAQGESVQVAFDYAKQEKKTLDAALRRHLESGLRKA